jgi:hypothetical protein
VLQHESALSLRDAVAAAVTSAPAEIQRFVYALEGWVRANLDWSIETGRYALHAPHTSVAVSRSMM